MIFWFIVVGKDKRMFILLWKRISSCGVMEVEGKLEMIDVGWMGLIE